MCITSVLQCSMLSHLSRNMGLLCSRSRHYNEQDSEENAQVNEHSGFGILDYLLNLVFDMIVVVCFFRLLK